jgi:hypothetical protein
MQLHQLAIASRHVVVARTTAERGRGQDDRRERGRKLDAELERQQRAERKRHDVLHVALEREPSIRRASAGRSSSTANGSETP